MSNHSYRKLVHYFLFWQTVLSTEDLDGLVNEVIPQALRDVHSFLFKQAQDRLRSRTFPLSSYADMKQRISSSSSNNSSNSNSEAESASSSDSAGFYLVPWKCDAKNEEAIKDDCKATIRCYPLDLNQQAPSEGTKCFYSGEQATHMAIFARAF